MTRLIRVLEYFQFGCVIAMAFGAAFGGTKELAMLGVTTLWICLLEMRTLRRRARIAEARMDLAEACLELYETSQGALR